MAIIAPRLLLVALLGASGERRGPGHNVPSAGDEYVEQVPTAAGARPVAIATDKGMRGARDVRPADVLSPRAAARLRAAGRSKLPQLTAIANSAGLGAPQEPAGGHQRAGSGSRTRCPPPACPPPRSAQR